jgi:glutathione S-transferase
MLELWHEWNSVHSFKARNVLAEKRLEWKEHRVELLKLEQLRPEYLKLNPNAVVPTLVHDGRPVYESSIICEYLDEAFPQQRLMPQDLHARAEARRWLKYHDEVAHAALRKVSLQLMFKPMLAKFRPDESVLRRHPNPERARSLRESASEPIDYAAVDEAIAHCRRIAERIEGTLGERPWLAGEVFGMADVAMAPFAERIDNLDMRFVWKAQPRTAAWAERILARPSVRTSMAPAPYRLPPPSADVTKRIVAWD